MPVKLKDIATQTGFSITTVSRALAGYDDVNAQTRQTIIETAQQMGYQPNLIARQLQSQRTHTIGMVLPADESSFTDSFFSELMLAVGHAASKRGYDLLMTSTPTIEAELDAYRRLLGGNRVDGIILARTRRNDPRIAYLQEHEHAFVVQGRLAPDEPNDFPYVDVDSQTGIELVVAHLASLGHQHMAILLPPQDIAFTAYRLAGYRAGLESAGLPFDSGYIRYGNLDRDSGYAHTRELIQQQSPLTAIIACNDLMAFGALRAVQEAGLIAGQDIAVTGFDDIAATRFASTPLTSVHQPLPAIGQHLVDTLIAILQGDPPDAYQVLLAPELVIRASSEHPIPDTQ